MTGQPPVPPLARLLWRILGAVLILVFSTFLALISELGTPLRPTAVLGAAGLFGAGLGAASVLVLRRRALVPSPEHVIALVLLAMCASGLQERPGGGFWRMGIAGLQVGILLTEAWVLGQARKNGTHSQGPGSSE